MTELMRNVIMMHVMQRRLVTTNHWYTEVCAYMEKNRGLKLYLM